MKYSYLAKLYAESKFLFCVVCIFFAAGVGANIVRLETTPFFLWNLYAERQPSREQYLTYEIIYPKRRFVNFRHSWNGFQEVMLTEPLQQYLSARANGGKDPWQDYLENYWALKHPGFRSLVHHLYNGPADYAQFPAWFSRYLSSIVGSPLSRIQILAKTLKFEPDGRISAVHADTVLVIP
jgi:hypothetical protein